MDAWIAVIGARYRTLLQYRAAAFAGFMTQLFWGGIRIMIFMAFYDMSTAEQPLSLAQTVTYVWLGQALLGMLPWNVDNELSAMIRSGSVSYELLRPLDLYGYWYCRSIALRTATTTLRSIPLVLLTAVLFPFVGLDEWVLAPPANGMAMGMFAVSILLAVLLAAAITMLMHVTLVWSIHGDGINRIMPGIVSVLAGNIIPLPLFPDWMQPALSLQPFRGLVDVPFRIYVGDIVGSQILLEIAGQVFWIGALVLLGRWWLGSMIRRMSVQGG